MRYTKRLNNRLRQVSPLLLLAVLLLTSLNMGITCYFIAQAKDNANASSNAELSFLTKPDPPTSSTAAAVSNMQIDLSWTKWDGVQRAMVHRKTESYPTGRNDGIQVYSDTGIAVPVSKYTAILGTRLSPDTTYYYRAWSEVSGSQQWSDDYAAASATASSEAPIAVGGEILPVNKAAVLAPWLILLSILSIAIGGGVLLARQYTFSQVYHKKPWPSA